MSSPSSHPFRWPLSIDAVWLAMPIFVVAIRTLLQPIPMEDYWWHLVMGRLIDAGQLPTTNTFLYTLPVDAPFYDQPWLAQWLMYLIAHHVGHVATVLVHCGLLVAAFVALVAVTVRRGGSAMAVGIGASVAYYVSASTLMPRTQMFAYPLFVLVAGGLLWLAAHDGAPRRSVGLVACGLVGVTAFWANVHGTFVLAPLLTVSVAGAWAVERRRRAQPLAPPVALRWLGLAGCVGLATAIAPGGIQNLIYPFKILSATKGASATVLEWTAASPWSLPGLLFYAAMAGSAWVLFRRRTDVTLPELAIFVPTALIALGSNRGILWWAMGAVIVVVPHLSAMRRAPAREVPGRGEAAFNVALLAALAGLALAAVPGGPLFRAVDPAALFGDGRLGPDGDAAVLSDLHPAGLAAELGSAAVQPLFHHQAVGGFLEWTLTTAAAPAAVAFIDQRLEIVPEALWVDYFDISRTREGWREVVERHGIQAYLVEPLEQEQLLKWLEASDEHVLLRRDRMWRLYVKRAR